MHAPPEPIVALDVGTIDDARVIVARLGDRAGFYKVGLQLFTAAGPAAIHWLHAEGKRVFLDLKLHDIPNTVRHAAASAGELGVSLLTIHGLGGEQMVRAAVEGAGPGTRVMVVTLLTSMDIAAASAALGRSVMSFEEEVIRQSLVARDAGAHGVVCAGAECAAVVRAAGPALSVLVPGIRRAGERADDQRRITTPGEAAAAGAGFVVLGRAVTAAADPRAAFEQIVAEMAV